MGGAAFLLRSDQGVRGMTGRRAKLLAAMQANADAGTLHAKTVLRRIGDPQRNQRGIIGGMPLCGSAVSCNQVARIDVRFEHTPDAEIASPGIGQYGSELIGDAAGAWWLPRIRWVRFRPIVSDLRGFVRQFFLVKNRTADGLLPPDIDA
ncbi:MAG: hypothetical protein U1E70_22700 [Acetobacteraceae bacterium]